MYSNPSATLKVNLLPSTKFLMLFYITVSLTKTNKRIMITYNLLGQKGRAVKVIFRHPRYFLRGNNYIIIR